MVDAYGAQDGKRILMRMGHGMVVDGHLGGYVPGGDPDTFYPQLWDWLVTELAVDSVVDVGCGEGQALGYFRGLGCDVFGIDGIYQPEIDDFCQHDYADGPLALNARDDLCWSCEFVEHVEEEHVPNFLATFASADLVLMTHATPGQPGWHHVNCQTDGYWTERLASIDYRLDEQLTARTRALAAGNGRDTNYYRDTGLAFRREEQT